jgi:thiol-disulfide isomerase/thioredoxin
MRIVSHMLPVIVMIAIMNSDSQVLKDLNSTSQLDSLIHQYRGKVLIINFWATWCEPCVHEFPSLVKLYRNYEDNNLALIFISLDQPDDAVKDVIPFLRKNGVDFITYINRIKKQDDLINKIDSTWDGAIPATYIYNREGIITSAFIGERTYADFEEGIKQGLNP